MIWKDDIRPLFWLPWLIIIVWIIPFINRSKIILITLIRKYSPIIINLMLNVISPMKDTVRTEAWDR